MSLRFLYAPQWLYMILGLGAGLFLAFLTPPYQVADEFYHFARVYQISRGELIASQDPESGLPGGLIPSSFRRVYEGTTNGIEFRPHEITSLARTRAALAIALRPDDETFEEFHSALYTPVPYLPQTLGVSIARWLEAPALSHLYAARLCALATALGLGWWTLRTLPFFHWPMLLLLLMPMTVFQSASASADSFTTALSFALFAGVARASVSASPISRREKIQLIALVVLVALCKQVYFVLAFLLLLPPGERFANTKDRWWFVGGGLGGALVAVLGWSWMISHLLSAPREGAEAARQLGVVLADPISFVELLLADYSSKSVHYFQQFVGVLGWFDTFLPTALHVSYGGLLILAAGVGGESDFALDAVRRTMLILLALGIVVLMPLISYLAFTAVGAEQIIGMQGRYFIPFAPVVLLALHNRKFAGLLKPPLMAPLTALFLIGVWIKTADAVISRYYGGLPRLMGWI